jgi:hypothetical protein
MASRPPKPFPEPHGPSGVPGANTGALGQSAALAQSKDKWTCAVKIASGLSGNLPILSEELDLIAVYLEDVIADLLASE